MSPVFAGVGNHVDRRYYGPDLRHAMSKKRSETKKRPLDYPEETEGSKIAAQIRKRVSGMTREQRAEHFKRGMVKIYGGQWPKEAAGTGH